MKEVDEQVLNVLNKNNSYFVAVCDILPQGLKLLAPFISNTTGTQALSRHIWRPSCPGVRAREWGRWREMEFTKAESYVDHLVSESQQYQDPTAEKVSEEEAEDGAVISSLLGPGQGWLRADSPRSQPAVCQPRPLCVHLHFFLP